ncbi:MAG: serine hydrolase domain-containing protein [Caldimonas sp.]
MRTSRSVAHPLRPLIVAASIAASPLAAVAQDAPLPRAAAAQVGFSDAGLARIDSFFEREIRSKRVPGAVVGIAREGKLVYYKAFGVLDPAKGTPMPLNAIFGLASMTKPMTAVGVLALTQEGRLPLHSSLADLYPGFATMKVAVRKADGSIDYEAQKRPIRIQDLLRHTAGLTYPGRADSSGAVSNLYPNGEALAKMASAAEYVDAITKLPLVYQPGTVFEYSQSFDVLSAVVEKVAGKTLGAHLDATIWKPLGMVDTTFRVPADKRDRIARPFAASPLDGRPQRLTTIEIDSAFECGGACAKGTVGDYLRFGQMLLDGGELEGQRVLGPQMVQLMTSNHLGKDIVNRVANVEPHRDGYGFGFGVAVRVEPGLASVPGNAGEYSWNGAFGTGFFADPKARLVVVFGTAAPGELRKYYREQVQDLVYGAMTR